jgi:hypothetical protein
LRPYRSCGLLILMEDAAEPVSSEDVRMIELAWFGERLGCQPWRLYACRKCHPGR